MTDEQAERIAKALESIAGSLMKMANPLMVARSARAEDKDRILPGPVVYVEGIDGATPLDICGNPLGTQYVMTPDGKMHAMRRVK